MANEQRIYYRREELIVYRTEEAPQDRRKKLLDGAADSLARRAVRSFLTSPKARRIAGEIVLTTAFLAGERLLTAWLERRALQGPETKTLLRSAERRSLPATADRPLLPPPR